MQPFSNWTDIEQHLSNADNQTKGELFEQITESYLKWSPKYQVILKQVWRLKDIPSRGIEHLIMFEPHFSKCLPIIIFFQVYTSYCPKYLYTGRMTRHILDIHILLLVVIYSTAVLANYFPQFPQCGITIDSQFKFVLVLISAF